MKKDKKDKVKKETQRGVVKTIDISAEKPYFYLCSYHGDLKIKCEFELRLWLGLVMNVLSDEIDVTGKFYYRGGENIPYLCEVKMIALVKRNLGIEKTLIHAPTGFFDTGGLRSEQYISLMRRGDYF